MSQIWLDFRFVSLKRGYPTGGGICSPLWQDCVGRRMGHFVVQRTSCGTRGFAVLRFEMLYIKRCVLQFTIDHPTPNNFLKYKPDFNDLTCLTAKSMPQKKHLNTKSLASRIRQLAPLAIDGKVVEQLLYDLRANKDGVQSESRDVQALMNLLALHLLAQHEHSFWCIVNTHSDLNVNTFSVFP